MRVLAAPDKFKASLTGLEAAQCLADGWRSVFPGDTVRLLPIADGGEGTAEIVCNARRGTWIELAAEDPLGRRVRARYASFEDAGVRTAVIEMSEVSGLWRLRREERSVLDATTRGTGQLLLHAIRELGAQRIILGLGGSATNDGGAGLAAALGFRLLDAAGEEIPPSPRHLPALARIERPPDLAVPPILIASDVTNPLLGDRGATAVYGPQKGLRPEERAPVEAALAHYADIVERDLGRRRRDTPGAGAAGGLGFGLLTFCGAEVRSGFELIADLIDLEAAIRECDLVLTGEGSLDGQTLEGKGPAGVGLLARRLGRRCAAFGGRIVPSVEAELRHVFDAVLPIAPGPIRFEDSVARGGDLLRAAAARAARWLALGRTLER
ncbi:MAG: glycerate kinase [Verrucomicrobia bacterium]|nr:glycerate kinase [Verrucomicrobiota bacterium]